MCDNIFAIFCVKTNILCVEIEKIKIKIRKLYYE